MHPEHQAKRIDQQLAFASRNCLVHNIVPYADHHGFDRPTVDAGGAGYWLSPALPPQSTSQDGVDTLPTTVDDLSPMIDIALIGSHVHEEFRNHMPVSTAQLLQDMERMIVA
jgi:hypothetical protein